MSLIGVKRTKKGKVRQKLELIEIVKNDMWIEKVTKNMTSNKIQWRKRIDVADPD